MNRQAILQSNLLDIIFENRNKDYGAYKLRKAYQKRLGIAVFSTVALALIVSLFLRPGNTAVVFAPVHPGFITPDTKISDFYRQPPRENKKTVMQHAVVKSIREVERPPLIVASDNINSLPATPAEIEPSFTGTGIPAMDFSPGGDGNDGGSAGNSADNPNLTLPDKSIPLKVAEIMPQYPGGIAALLAFLKKNIHAPGNVEEGEDVTVKIEFIVNYNGNLENFIVVKSGGAIFDNEVLKVLKKMPAWIPGKSAGENVSVYYTVPVKFTGGF